MIDTYAATTPHAPTQPCPLALLELAIVRHLADGHTRPRIARELDITKKALDTAIARMFHRIHAANATHLVAIALRAGWIR